LKPPTVGLLPQALLVATAMACGNQGFEKEAELLGDGGWMDGSEIKGGYPLVN